MLHFLFARQHTTRNTGGVMKSPTTHNTRGGSPLKHAFTMTAEVITILLIFALGVLLLAL